MFYTLFKNIITIIFTNFKYTSNFVVILGKFWVNFGDGPLKLH